MPRPTRAHMALVILGATLAVFGLLVLQVVLPLVLGSWGLAAVVALDVSLFLVYRHRRFVRPVPPGYVLTARGLEDRRLAQREAHAEARKIAGAVFVALFVIGLYAMGVVVQGVAMINGEPGLYIAGAALYAIGAGLVTLIFWDYFPWGSHLLKLELTEDD